MIVLFVAPGESVDLRLCEKTLNHRFLGKCRPGLIEETWITMDCGKICCQSITVIIFSQFTAPDWSTGDEGGVTQAC